MLEPFIDSLGSRLIRIAQDPNLSGGIYTISISFVFFQMAEGQVDLSGLPLLLDHLHPTPGLHATAGHFVHG